MKTIYAVLLGTILVTTAMQAQTEKGIYMLGGTTNLIGTYPGALPNQVAVGFGKNKKDSFEVNYTNLNLSTNGGYFVSNGLLFGLNLSAFHGNTVKKTKREIGPDVEVKHRNTYLAVAPFIRYYLNQGRKIQYYGEARVGLSTQKLDDDDSGNSVLVGAKLGAAMFLNKKVSLDFFYDFSGAFTDVKTVGRSTNIFDAFNGFGFGLDFFL